MMHNGDLERNYNLQKVKRNYQIGKGIITQISSYKGHSIHIKYHVNTIEYNYEGGFATNPNGLEIADSINIKYAIDSPKYVISELDENYLHF